MNSSNNNKTQSLETPAILRNHYRYVRILGEGSNGKTYLAKVLSNNKEVAIKALKFSDDIKAVELFKREADALKSVNEEGVPLFYEAIYQQGGIGESYLIQEYVPWPSIQELLDTYGFCHPKTALEIVYQVAAILYKLQTHYVPPIIHRDIKPSNILIHLDDTGNLRETFLIDFGAVANPQKQSGGSTIAGTFGFMAPEQLMGEVSLQSDFYSLGATALYLLTGVAPFDMPSDGFKLQYEDILKQKAPKVDDGFKSLLDVLLSPGAQDRPKNANELLQMIQNVMKGGAITKTSSIDKTSARLLKRLSKKFNDDTPKHFVFQEYKAKIRTVNDVYCRGTRYSTKHLEMTYQVEGMCLYAFYQTSDYKFKIWCENNPNAPHQPVNCCKIMCDPTYPYIYFFEPQDIVLDKTLAEQASASGFVVKF